MKHQWLRRWAVWGLACTLGLLTLPAAAEHECACFSEADWGALQRSTAPAGASGVLLYVWSPRMVLSAVHAHEVAQVAAEQGLRFVPVHDGRLAQAELQQALQALSARQQANGPPNVLAGTQSLCANSLVQQDAYRHFPTAWLVQHGQYHPVPLVSAMPSDYWRLGIRLRAKELLQAGQEADKEMRDAKP